jgi:hypothetical protein
VPQKLHIAFNEATYTKIQIAAVREGVNCNCSRVWRNVTWTVGSAVNCVATVDVTNRHIRTVIWETKGGFVSNNRQERNTRQARDSSRCSTVGVSSYIATVTVTGSRSTGANRLKFMLREGKHLMSCIETVRLIVRKQRGVSWGLLSTNRFSIVNLIFISSNRKGANLTKTLLKKQKSGKEIEFHSDHEEKIKQKKWKRQTNSRWLASRGLFWSASSFTNRYRRHFKLLLQKQTLYLQLYCLWPSDGSTE